MTMVLTRFGNEANIGTWNFRKLVLVFKEPAALIPYQKTHIYIHTYIHIHTKAKPPKINICYVSNFQMFGLFLT